MQEIQNGMFVCAFPGCHKNYSTKFALKRHALTHSKVKKFKCRFCDRRFALEQYLKEHEYIHTNETPYVCGIDGCTESFRQRAKLCLHRKSHSGYKKKQYKTYSKTKGNKMTACQTVMPYVYDNNYSSTIMQDANNTEDQLKSILFGMQDFGLPVIDPLEDFSNRFWMWDLYDGRNMVYAQQDISINDWLALPLPTSQKYSLPRPNLNPLEISKASGSLKGEELCSPSTYAYSPTLLRPANDNSFTTWIELKPTAVSSEQVQNNSLVN